MLNTTQERMKEEILTELKNGAELEEIKDNSGEWVDNWLPVYNDQIIKEWQNMPSEYDNRGYAELGGSGEITIINLMTLDLYLYYSDLWNEVMEEVESELEEVSA